MRLWAHRTYLFLLHISLYVTSLFLCRHLLCRIIITWNKSRLYKNTTILTLVFLDDNTIVTKWNIEHNSLIFPDTSRLTFLEDILQTNTCQHQRTPSSHQCTHVYTKYYIHAMAPYLLWLAPISFLTQLG